MKRGRGEPSERSLAGDRPVHVERVRSGDDTSAIDAIARECFAENSFSVAEELGRPGARVWSARPASGAHDQEPAGFLVAWHVADELHVQPLVGSYRMSC